MERASCLPAIPCTVQRRPSPTGSIAAACRHQALALSVPQQPPTERLTLLPAGGVFSPKVNFFLPGDTDFETALFKNVPLNEKGMKLQLRVETYNTFNHSEFNAVNASTNFTLVTSGTPGVTPNTYNQTNSQLGQFSGTAAPRYMQLALRLDF